jgi:hypothetical protein
LWRAAAKRLKSLERVKGIEPSSPAWKEIAAPQTSTSITEKQQPNAPLIENKKFSDPKWPLRRVWLLTPRPSMPPGHVIAAGETPGGGKMDFCWLVFEHQLSGIPQIGWLHRDEAVSS